MLKKIKFLPSDYFAELNIESPIQSSKCIPDWYQKAEKPNYKKLSFSSNPDFPNTPKSNLKMCVPFLDAMTAGYIQKTWSDIYIEFDEKNNYFQYRTSTSDLILEHRNKYETPIKDSFYEVELAWAMPWIPKTPKGYSILITNPLNSFDSPIFTTSGIIDSDKFFHSLRGRVPFYIKKGFSGLIPVGTPMYQIIPIKRDSWISQRKKFNEKQQLKNSEFMKKRFYRTYRDVFWQKKDYK